MQKLIDLWTSTHQNFNAWGVKSANAVPQPKQESHNPVQPSQSSLPQFPTAQGQTIGQSIGGVSGHGSHAQPIVGQGRDSPGNVNTPMGGMTPPPEMHQ
jgi:hypothetical protein